MAETIAERIRALREEKGWSKVELGRRVGVKNGRVTVLRWEAGEVTPKPETVKKLATVFGVLVEAIDPSGSAYKHTGPRKQSRSNKNARHGVQSRAGSTEEPYTPALEELLSMMRNIPDQGPLMILGGALQSVPAERRLDFALHCANQARAFTAGRPATGTAPNK